MIPSPSDPLPGGPGPGASVPAGDPSLAKVEQAEALISTILRVGVLASLAIIILGTVLSFARHPDYRADPQSLDRLTGREAQFPHTFAQVTREVVALRGHGLVMLGILLLIATPVVRVAASVWFFRRQGDRAFTLITLAVLILLLLSLVLGQEV